VALARPAAAQLGSGWDQPQTANTRAVASAVGRGLCAQAALDFIASTTGLPTRLVNAGVHDPAGNRIVWYAKGPGCDGKFQYETADLGYVEGWEIRWDPSSWVAGPGDPSSNGMHPTQWQLHPLAPWQGPPNLPNPANPANPANLPNLPNLPNPVLPSIDLSPVLAQIAILTSKVDALAASEAGFHHQVADKWEKTGGFVLKYVAPAVAAIFAGRASK
jgi:hypothetical protein